MMLHFVMGSNRLASYSQRTIRYVLQRSFQRSAYTVLRLARRPCPHGMRLPSGVSVPDIIFPTSQTNTWT